jgi:hypothetical protein
LTLTGNEIAELILDVQHCDTGLPAAL